MSFRLILSLPLLALPAHAQVTDSEAELRAQTVIVTSPGPERTAGELISNVTAITREEIITDLQGTLGDTLANQPGVSTTYFGAGASRPVLRGLGSERVLVLTNGLGVIDVSAASPDHQVTADGIDAERIEILRGPAALAYGGQAIGGVVNVIDGLVVRELPEKPVSGQLYGAYNSVSEGDELGGRANFAFGDFVLALSATQWNFDDYEIPGFAESARFRALEEEEHDHDEDDDHDDDHDEDEDHDHEEDEEIRDLLENSFLESNTFGAGLSWVGDNGYFGIAVRRQEADYGLPGHSHEHGEDEHDHDDEDHEDEDHEDEDHDEDEHGHEEESPFISLEQTRVDLQAGWNVDHNVIRSVDARFSASEYEHAEYEGPGEIGTQYFTEGYEGRVEVDHFIGPVEGTFGFQFTDTEFNAVGEEAFITPTDSSSFGVFVFEAREFDSGFGWESGLRLEKVARDNQMYGSRDFGMLSGSVGIHQHWQSGLFLGAQVSVAERAPNESELFANGAHLATDQYEVGNPDMDVERGTNFEVTARWLGDNLSLGANVFVTKFSDFIYLTPGEVFHAEDGEFEDEVDGFPVFVFMQDDADFVGGEVYGSYHLEDGPLGAHWDFDASLDLVNAELDNGGNVPYLSPVSFNGDIKADWGLVDAGVGIVHAADQDDTGAGILPTDGYTVFNLSAGLDLAEMVSGVESARLFVQARNITDEEIRYSTSVLKDQVPAPGRNVRVGLSAKF